MNEQSYLQDVRGSWGMRGFTAGVIVGAGIALLLAPATGNETRRKLGDAAKRIGNDARKGLDGARHGVGSLKSDAKAAVEAGRDAYMRSRQSHQGQGETPPPPARITTTRPV